MSTAQSGPSAALPSSERQRAYLGVFATVFLWGSNVVLLKWLLGFMPAATINVTRFAVAGVLLLALTLWRDGWPRWDRRTWLSVAVLGVVGNSVFQEFFLLGISHSPAGVSGVVNGVVPVLVVTIGAALGQRPSRQQWLGVAVSLVGLILLTSQTLVPGSPLTLGGLGLLFLAALAWSSYTLGNRPLSARLGAVPFVSWALVLGCLPYLIWNVPRLAPVQAPLVVWLGVVGSALGANVFAYLAWANGARVLGATQTSVLNNLAPAIALILSALLLGERLPPLAWGAAGIIIAGVLLTNLPGRRRL
jgi:drug/metabolite transporter (DMT)-like permease